MSFELRTDPCATGLYTKLSAKPSDNPTGPALRGGTRLGWRVLCAWCALCLGLGLGLSLGNSPVYAQSGAQIDDVSVELLVSTQSGETTVFNGEDLAYTILVSNNTDETVSDLLVLDVLPESVLDNVQCLDDPEGPQCDPIIDTETIPDPLGGTLTISTTRQVSWSVSELDPGEQQQFSFLARVVGQTDGATFGNIAYVTYRQGGQSRTANSQEVELTVRVRLEQGGQTILTDTPTWFSEDAGGTLSMDWADFDGDGDLDLALGSTLGPSVYRNTNGQLEQFWQNEQRAFGVRWADVTGNGRPELIVVGEVEGDATANIAQQPGINSVFQYNVDAASTNQRFVTLSTFTTTVQVVRLDANDFTGDDRADVIVSTNAINAACPVELFVNDGTGNFPDEPVCVSRAASAALKAVDFDNDGSLDIVLGQFPNRVRVMLNDGEGNFSQTRSVSVEESVLFLPYDFAWADIDGDGWLDLAAAYPLLREARVYRNLNGQGMERIATVRTDVFLTPYALDWGDFNGDGKIDLALGDVTPRIYTYTGETGADAFQRYFSLEDGVVRGQIWSLRGVDVDGDGDVDLVVTDRDGPSLVISNFRPPLSSTLRPVTGVSPFDNLGPASSVAWADVSGDGTLDLLLGAGPPEAGPAALNTKLYFNSDATFAPDTVRAYSGFGPVATAYGDVTRNGAMDLVLSNATQVMLFLNGDFLSPAWSIARSGQKAVTLGDVTGDGTLDLLVGYDNGTTGSIDLYLNAGAGFTTTPDWTVTDLPPVTSLALADYDRDGFLDLGVGSNGRNRVYRNSRNESFNLAWTASTEDDTRSVAWADFDGDGSSDFTVGNYDGANLIYSFNGEGFDIVWTSDEEFPTTSVDWGDWDNDGDLDLAVGNDGGRDQILVNLDSTPGNPQLAWLWSSDEQLDTTQVAWGDMDGDGDLDLAISQDGDALSGIYVNNYRYPAHIVGSEIRAANVPLFNVPSYVALNRPGDTRDAYQFSAAEILAGPDSSTVSIPYRAYNPSAARSGNDDAVGAYLQEVRFEYSLDGGGTWRTATQAQTTNAGCREGQVDINTADIDQLQLIMHIEEAWAQEIITLRQQRAFSSVDDMFRIVGLGEIRLQEIKDEGVACVSGTDGALTFATAAGREGVFPWNARQDQAISDNVHFRVTVVDATRSGPVQRISASAISPPFRVRAVTCVWPEGPSIQVRLPGTTTIIGSSLDSGPVSVDAHESIQFVGRLDEGTGPMEYTWDFSNSFTDEGQVTQMTFPNGTFLINMRVEGEPCPQNRERYDSVVLVVGSGTPSLYMPQVGAAAGSVIDDDPEGTAASRAEVASDDASDDAGDDILARMAQRVGPVPARVPGFDGDVRADTGDLWMRWQAVEVGNGTLDGYRIYRGHRDDDWPLPLLTQVDARQTAFVDETSTCDLVYYVTAYNQAGESLPSTTSYYTPACD